MSMHEDYTLADLSGMVLTGAQHRHILHLLATDDTWYDGDLTSIQATLRATGQFASVSLIHSIASQFLRMPVRVQQAWAQSSTPVFPVCSQSIDPQQMLNNRLVFFDPSNPAGSNDHGIDVDFEQELDQGLDDSDASLIQQPAEVQWKPTHGSSILETNPFSSPALPMHQQKPQSQPQSQWASQQEETFGSPHNESRDYQAQEFERLSKLLKFDAYGELILSPKTPPAEPVLAECTFMQPHAPRARPGIGSTSLTKQASGENAELVRPVSHPPHAARKSNSFPAQQVLGNSSRSATPRPQSSLATVKPPLPKDSGTGSTQPAHKKRITSVSGNPQLPTRQTADFAFPKVRAPRQTSSSQVSSIVPRSQSKPTSNSLQTRQLPPQVGPSSSPSSSAKPDAQTWANASKNLPSRLQALSQTASKSKKQQRAVHPAATTNKTPSSQNLTGKQGSTNPPPSHPSSQGTPNFWTPGQPLVSASTFLRHSPHQTEAGDGTLAPLGGFDPTPAPSGTPSLGAAQPQRKRQRPASSSPENSGASDNGQGNSSQTPVVSRSRKPGSGGNGFLGDTRASRSVVVAADQVQAFLASFDGNQYGIPERMEGHFWYCPEGCWQPKRIRTLRERLPGRFKNKREMRHHMSGQHDIIWTPTLPEVMRETVMTEAERKSRKVRERMRDVYKQNTDGKKADKQDASKTAVNEAQRDANQSQTEDSGEINLEAPFCYCDESPETANFMCMGNKCERLFYHAKCIQEDEQGVMPAVDSGWLCIFCRYKQRQENSEMKKTEAAQRELKRKEEAGGGGKQ